MSTLTGPQEVVVHPAQGRTLQSLVIDGFLPSLWHCLLSTSLELLSGPLMHRTLLA